MTQDAQVVLLFVGIILSAAGFLIQTLGRSVQAAHAERMAQIQTTQTRLETEIQTIKTQNAVRDERHSNLAEKIDALRSEMREFFSRGGVAPPGRVSNHER